VGDLPFFFRGMGAGMGTDGQIDELEGELLGKLLPEQRAEVMTGLGASLGRMLSAGTAAPTWSAGLDGSPSLADWEALARGVVAVGAAHLVPDGIPGGELSLAERDAIRRGLQSPPADDLTEMMLFQQRSQAYNYIQNRVAKNLARDNRIKREQNAGPKSPPSWVIKTHPSMRKQDNTKKKTRERDNKGARNRSAKGSQNKARGRGRRAREVDKFEDDGSQARGNFNSIEMGFGLMNSVHDEEEDEILARYPISHEFSHLGSQTPAKGAGKRGTKKTPGSVFDSTMSDDMIQYLARVKKKENQQAKLRSERLKATAYFSDKFG